MLKLSHSQKKAIAAVITFLIGWVGHAAQGGQSAQGAQGNQGTQINQSKDLAENEPIKMKVIKSKSGKAVILHNKKIKLEPNQIYFLMKSAPKMAEAKPVENEESRAYSLGAEFSAELLTQKRQKPSTSESLNKFDTNLIFGWNKERFEFGPFLAYTFTRAATLDTKTISGGGYLDINFIPNKIEESHVIGFRLLAGMASEDNSAYTGPGVGYVGQGGLYYKWFGFSTNLAFVIHAAYKIESLEWQDNKIDRSGVVGRVGVQSYF